MKRVLLGGILAGGVVFVWGFIGHALLPLGTVGIQSLPAEETVLPVLQQRLKEPGFYFFPAMPASATMTAEQREQAQKQWAEKIRQGPRGILVYHPAGAEPMSTRQLGGELVTNVLGGLIAAILLSMAAVSLASFASRLMFVTLLGLFASLAIEMSYWIWYSFPTAYTVAQTADQVIGWFLAGIPLAAIIRKP
ncbi:MAG TPA: hypothetical protein VEY91_11880 [Candidatus Limnocylindria bacterium]|nr:hypothetical protein [Candidatus Limnocylindria bacterium]